MNTKRAYARRKIYSGLLLSGLLIAGFRAAWSDTTDITAALNAPVIGATGGAIVHWGPIVSQSSIDMSGSSNLNYPQKFAGSYITGNGGPAGTRSYCNPNPPNSGPGTIIPPSTVPVYEWYCNNAVPPAPQVSFEDYKYLAQLQGNSCGGHPCYNAEANPSLSSLVDPVCTVDGHPKVWFFEGNPSFSGSTYFCGVLVTRGSIGFTGGGAGLITVNPPSTAWQQYQVVTPNGAAGFGDTSASNEYPGDAGLHTVAPFNFATGGGGFNGNQVTFNGYIFASTGYSATGNTIVVGAVQFGAGAASSSGGGTIFYQPETIFSPPPANTVNQPIITPPGGNFCGPVVVQIGDTTAGAVIYYSLDGSTPNQTSILYTGPFTVSSTTTVKAIAVKSGLSNSVVATANFTFSCGTGNPGSTPAPILNSISPNSRVAGSTGFTLTANGSQFVNGAVITWNGSSLSTTFGSSLLLTASVPASLIASPGTANIQVRNPDNQVSGILPFTIISSTVPGGPGSQLPLDHIVVSPSHAALAPSETHGFSAQGYDRDNNLIPNTVFDWAFSGPNSIAPVSASTWTVFTAGSTAGVYSLTATSNSISGQAVVEVETGAGVVGGLWIVDPASANPNPVTGTSTQLHVLAQSTNPGPISYRWEFIGLAALIQSPTTNDTQVTFTRPGSYTFQVTIRDSAGLELRSTVSVAVQQVVSRVVVSPAQAVISVGQSFPFTAQAFDQWNQVMSTILTWSTSAGSISQTGSYVALSPMANVTVTARAPNGVVGTAQLNVQSGRAPGDVDLSRAKAYPVPFKSTSGLPGITFANLTANTTIRLYTTDGRLVHTLHSLVGENVIWTVKNSKEERVASGVYIFRISNDAGKLKEGKIVIIQ
jgi:hypothetical protein